MNALALTDHGNLHGALEFYQKAPRAGIKPIVGYEAYIAPGSRFDKTSGSMREASYHLTLLAQNRTGFQNLMKLASAAYLEGFYFKPRIDKELLAAHSEGIICLSGCVSSEFNRRLAARTWGRGGAARSDRSGPVVSRRVWRPLLHRDHEQRCGDPAAVAATGRSDVANKVGLPLVATCDTHYVDRVGCRSPGRVALHQHGQVPHRHESHEDGW